MGDPKMIGHDAAREIYGQLSMLREFTPEGTAPSEHIDLFHRILSELEHTEGDFSRFRIPIAEIELAPKTLGPTCNGLFLRKRIKDLLGLFTTSNENGSTHIALTFPR